MDLTTMTDEELRDLVQQVSELLTRRAQERLTDEERLRVDVGQAIASLDALIGPDEPAAPAMTSITEVRLHTRQQMQDNAGLGLELAFQGLELLARTVRDIAHIAAR